MNKLYKKLLSLNLLKRAWHLARHDTRSDFIHDPHKYNDYAYKLDENLNGLLICLKQETYHPHPILRIDVPKSSLTVRPGTKIEIEDRIVLFAIACLIAPIIDKKLPPTVYSYRLKESFDKKDLFKDSEILEFPFLKKKTIQKEIQVFEPWYGQWPIFLQQSIYAYEKEGYNRLSVSDIAAYFENINLEILRDILLQELPKEQKLINLLIAILEHWVWKTHDGRLIGRGIPQGNSVSSFLANIYLLPLDRAFIKFSKKYDIKYFRYMDDVKIFSKEEATARRVIFQMNETLRHLHLNMQGSKTEILRNEEISEEIDDERLTKTNEYIKAFQGKKITQIEKKDFVIKLKKEYKKIKSRKKTLKNKDLRLFRRIITGLTLLQDGTLVNRLLLEIERNPDYKLMTNAVRYLRFVLHRKIVITKLFEFLKSPENIFVLQEALIFQIMRYLKIYDKKIINYSKEIAKSKTKHWYVRVQTYLLIGQLPLSKKYLISLKARFDDEVNNEIRRAMIIPLCQLEEEALIAFYKTISFNPSPKISRLGIMLYDLRENKEAAIKEINNIFGTFDENKLIDNLYKIEVIKYHEDLRVKEILKRNLKLYMKKITRPHLKKQIDIILKSIEK